jgi:hypothetical protein
MPLLISKSALHGISPFALMGVQSKRNRSQFKHELYQRQAELHFAHFAVFKDIIEQVNFGKNLSSSREVRPSNGW